MEKSGAEALEESKEEDLGGFKYRTFDFGEKNWDEQLDVLDEDEAKAAEAIRRMRQG